MQDVDTTNTIMQDARPLEGNTPLVLAEPGAVWCVQGGSVDIFAVEVSDGRPTGARHHICHLDPGEPFFGGTTPGGGTVLGLIAVGTVGTTIRNLAPSLSTSPDHLLDAVHAWMTSLGTGATIGSDLQTQRQLVAGAASSLRPGERARPLEGVAWVDVRAGSVSLLGSSSVTAEDLPHPFPVAETTWLEATTPATIDVLDDHAALLAAQVWAGLAGWHALLLQALQRRFDAETLLERSRLDREITADGLLRTRALGDLAGVLSETRAEAQASPDESPLVGAFRLITRSLDVELRLPPDTGADTTRDELSQITRASRLRSRLVLLSSGWWSQDGGPILGYRGEERTPVALLPTGSGRYDIADSSDGSRTRVTEEISASLAPEGWAFYRPFPDKALSLMDLVRLGLRGSRRDGIRIAMLAVIASLLALLTPIATSMLFGRLIPNSQERQLIELAGVLALSAIAIALFQIVRSIAVTRIEARIDASVQPAIWDRLLRLPAGFFRTYSAGDLAMRANGIDQARQLLTGNVLSSVLGGVSAVTSAALLVYYDARLALVALLFTVVALGVTVIATWRQLQFQRRMTALQTSISGMVLQFLTGIPKLRVAGAEDRAYAAWASRFSQQKKEGLHAQATANDFNVFNATWPVLGVVVIFALVAREGDEGIATANLLAFLVAFTQFMTATLMIATTVTSILQCVPLYEQARPILTAVPEVDVAKADPGRLSGAIELSHVSFRYTPDGPLAVNDISLEVQPGEFIALVGPSGAGKSSIFRLLLGFDVPESGSIYFDGKDLARLDAEAVRRQLGVVTQDSRVMPGTIQANIIGSSLLTVQDAWEAARMAGLDDDIRQMPMGMQTIISEGGGTFSGGQLQRLMIARAIVRKPRILLFDEATSALDNRTQAIVSQSLERLQATRIVIAHRLSTIEHADRIFVFQAGRIVQSGTYGELINQPGAFADLARRQIA